MSGVGEQLLGFGVVLGALGELRRVGIERREHGVVADRAAAAEQRLDDGFAVEASRPPPGARGRR